MSKINSQSGFTGTACKRQIRINRNWLSALLVLALLLGLSPARAEGPDDQYLQAYNIIQQADDLNTQGKTGPAKAKYQEAQAALKSFKKDYADWNVKLVAYRMNYVVGKIAALSEKPAAGAQSEPPMAQIKLLEAGAEPRTVLRLHPKPGDKQTLNMTMKMAMETKVGEAETPGMKLPEIKMTLESTVKEVSANGDITCEQVLTDISVSDDPSASPEVAGAIKTVFAGLKGLAGTGTVSSRGVSKGVVFKAPPGANPQARQFMDQMKDLFTQLGAPLPEEAVGPGAKWESKTPIKAQGMTIDQTATYEVVSIEGDRLITKNTMAQLAANQKIENPAMPGLKMDLIKLAGSGTGERTFDLAHLLPVAGTGNVHSETAMAMNMGGQKQPMTMKMDMTLQFEAK